MNLLMIVNSFSSSSKLATGVCTATKHTPRHAGDCQAACAEHGVKQSDTFQSLRAHCYQEVPGVGEHVSADGSKVGENEMPRVQLQRTARADGELKHEDVTTMPGRAVMRGGARR